MFDSIHWELYNCKTLPREDWSWYEIWVYCENCRQKGDWISLKKCIDDINSFGMDKYSLTYYKQFLKVLESLNKKDYENVRVMLKQILYEMKSEDKVSEGYFLDEE